MSAVKLAKSNVPVPFKLELEPRDRLVGGGRAGVARHQCGPWPAPRPASRCTWWKRKRLWGGFLGKMAKLAPENPPLPGSGGHRSRRSWWPRWRPTTRSRSTPAPPWTRPKAAPGNFTITLSGRRQLPLRGHRTGHRLAALRAREPGRGAGLRLQPGHHHQRGHGSQGQGRRSGRPERRGLHSVRGQPRPKPPALLLGGVLHREPQAGHDGQGSQPRGGGVRHLQGHPHPRPERGSLSRGPAQGRGVHPPRRGLPQDQRVRRQAGHRDHGHDPQRHR